MAAKLRRGRNFAAVKFLRCRCRGLLLAPLLLAVSACQRPDDPPQPADLLPKERMIPLLADLHVLESQVENSRLSPDSARALYREQQRGLLWNREVTDSAFQRSYRFYGVHGKDLNDIYTAVIDTLAAREKKLALVQAKATPPPPAAPPAAVPAVAVPAPTPAPNPPQPLKRPLHQPAAVGHRARHSGQHNVPLGVGNARH